MTINIEIPENDRLKPVITVFGVGGAGGNAVNNMINANLAGINFVVANTDAQAIQESVCANKIQLGINLTRGLGAGSYPEVGKAAAEESADLINEYLEGNNMIFITVGLGGGTGSGAAPVVAKLAREKGILTVAVATKPFSFEGSHRMRVAELGMEELQKYVDTLIVIPNQNLFRIADKNTTFLNAFKMADDVLHAGVRGITDLMVVHGLINLDFADVRSVMSEMGKAMMGTGEAEGEDRAIKAAESAISNPLLDNISMQGAKGVLVNITGGSDMTLFEVDEATNRIKEEVDKEANIIFGSAFNKDLDGKIRVSVVATGIDSEENLQDLEEETNKLQQPQSNNYNFAKEEPANEENKVFQQQNELEKEEEAFIAPPPSMPEEDENDFVQESDKPKVKIKKKSIFSSIFGSSEAEEEDVSLDLEKHAENQNIQETNEQKPSNEFKNSLFENQLFPEKNQNMPKQEDLEIPAYLRKKN